ncbi:MAG: glycosyltransferase [Desulfobulbus sp.]|nr:glycosyltransferase [Desulfobulbus sp.]
MRVALVHYHLQGGGVTKIVCLQQKALGQRGIATVALSGKPPVVRDAGNVRVVPGLQYEADRPSVSPAELAAQMRAEARSALGGDPDLWHVHNHSLGKNLVLPSALGCLIEQGERFLFQIHDFAEDGRPGNYRAMLAAMAAGCRRTLFRLLYPRGGQLHYAVLNRRDFHFLQEAGLDADHLHFLRNPVDMEPVGHGTPTALPGQAPLWLYPTRGIRRKNLGEFLLWSALAPQGTRFGTTSGPENPAANLHYRRWRQLAGELRLPVQFEMVGPGGPSFVELLNRADVAVTTSVAEGFGMAFLEPWSLGVPVFGRNLSEIMPSADNERICLPWNYDRLDVPVEWLGRARIEQAAREGMQRCLAAYGRCPGKDDVHRALVAWIRDGGIDFGRLDEVLQETVLRRLVATRAQSALIEPVGASISIGIRDVVTANQSLLRSRYTLACYGEAMEAIYLQVADSTTGAIDNLDGEVLLDRFLAPERLSLLRVD